jgi:hypothetical protein
VLAPAVVALNAARVEVRGPVYGGPGKSATHGTLSAFVDSGTAFEAEALVEHLVPEADRYAIGPAQREQAAG